MLCNNAGFAKGKKPSVPSATVAPANDTSLAQDSRLNPAPAYPPVYSDNNIFAKKITIIKSFFNLLPIP